jgi:hypothetical protein
MLKGLDKKEIDIHFYSNKLLQNKNLISEYLEGLTSKNQIYKENCFYVLKTISENDPDFLYSYWDYFVNHMRSNNNYHKTAALILLSNLTAVDHKGKFEKIFDEFYGNLKSEKTMMPAYLTKYSGKIVKNKPKLEDKITDILLHIEQIHPGKQIELVKAAVIESLSEIFIISKNKKKIIRFVKNQLDSSSPKTKKIAQNFLKEYVEQ